MEAAKTTRRALVTGCAGFIASHLGERLLATGWTVRGVDSFTDYYPEPIKRANLERLLGDPGFELYERDLSSDPIDDCLEGVEVIFHLAAQAGVRGSFGRTFDVYVRDNVLATQRVLDAAVRHGISRVVYASSSSVYGNAETMPTSEDVRPAPVSPYGMTKVATEELARVYARTHGIASVGLRYFTVYGPRQRPDMAFHRFMTAALTGEPITILGDGRQIRDFTFVADAVAATAAAGGYGEPGAHVFNIGAGHPIELIEVIDMIGELAGRPLELRHRERQAGDARHTSADVSRAAAALGYQPGTRLAEGLAAQLSSVRRSLGAARVTG